MKTVTFIDLEVSLETKRIVDYGAINSNGEMMHVASLHSFKKFLLGTDFICGHNIIHHDLKYLHDLLKHGEDRHLINEQNAIDTLYLSALFIPQRPSHKLVKDDKLQSEELNNPLNDAKKARELFFEEVDIFLALPNELKKIYNALLKNQTEFGAFFRFLNINEKVWHLDDAIKSYFKDKICHHVNLNKMIVEYPIELAYSLALIHAKDQYAITPRWILKQYPKVNSLIDRLRGTPCIPGCPYCDDKLDIYKGLNQIFGYDKYRDFDGVPLQEQAVEAAINNKSLLDIFPTGGGKSITFQVPALMDGKNTKGLTVVISPLQSLMKDQVDNLERFNITEAVTINGLLNPLERSESFRRVEEGEASMLYISPESLRSRSIEKLLLGRKISRFVIDEAHCFSSWGQDFRVDYLYIADFIKNLCAKKCLDETIPVSCFTATAKQNVIDDIMYYFQEKLGIELELYTATSGRTNLSYKVVKKDEEEKYHAIRDLLEYNKCPTIIYVSRTKKANELTLKLNNDGYTARAYHGKMEKNEKSENQDAFIRGEVDIMVATSAFGMGVDKKDVGKVIHYDISDSLENYVQEAGRAGRDQEITAECYALFNEEDLNKHFMLLNQTKITLQEIQQVWSAIKDTTKTRSRMSNSALEIAREAGWDENVREIETRVKTAIAALENAGYIKRGQNMPRVYADSILAKNMIEAADKVKKAQIFNPAEEITAARIMSKLISSRSRKHAMNEVPETRIDYISDDLGIKKDEVIHIVQKLREANVLADAKDLTVYMDEKDSMLKARNHLNLFKELEKFLLNEIPIDNTVINMKELNELAEEQGIKKASADKIKKILNFWTIKKIIKRGSMPSSQNHLKVRLLKDKDKLRQEFEKRSDVAEFILSYLENIKISNENYIHFSVLELKEEYDIRMQILMQTTTSSEVEDALLYLTRIGALKLEGGFLVTYNSLSIERLEKDNKIRYKVEDYKNLKRYYDQKTQMIHIVGEYARKMMEDYRSALQFVEDYFQLEYSSFLRKYFRGSKGDEITRNITPKKFKQLFGELSVDQLNIINDKSSQHIVVAAGPGSGKTRILVHKLASLLLMEDVKHEQLLMLTFSRAAATEFKKRLMNLIGNASHFVEIKTFHSYCFDLLGRVGNLEKSGDIIKEATLRIESGEVEQSRITKTVLVIDEAQDMDQYEYRLIKTLIEKNDGLRVIAVGDDDQNIFSFRGSNSRYMQEILKSDQAVMYELIKNYRSKANLVQFTNVFLETMRERMKKTPIISNQSEHGRIEVIQYEGNHVILPAITKMLNEDIKGSTCVLTKTNEEALLVCGLLHKNGIKAKLIQNNESVSLYNLVEIRYFLSLLKLTKESYIIREENWNNAIKDFKAKYANSENYPLCEHLFNDFSVVNNKYKYKTDFELFLRESKIEDFYDHHQGGVVVSTIHKSKGWEFDHVIMILSDIFVSSDEQRRIVYVGMTRAKNSLNIHFNGNLFNENNPYGLIKGYDYKIDKFTHDATSLILEQLNYRDVYLDYFKNTQNGISHLISGEPLRLDDVGCLDQNNHRVLKFSSKFKEKMKVYQEKGYQLKQAKVKSIIYWKKENTESEILVLLPEIEWVKK